MLCSYYLFFAFPVKDKRKQKEKNIINSETKDTVTYQVSNSMVQKIRQARNVDILIASWKGVFRYDGQSFTSITSTISSPRFWDVPEDRKGNLWFATRDSGVYYYPSTPLRAGEKFLPVRQAGFQHFTTREGLANNRALHIYEDKAGTIWFTTGGGSSRYDGKSLRFDDLNDLTADHKLFTQ